MGQFSLCSIRQKNDIKFLFSICLVSAKFLKLEQLDHDVALPTDTTGVSVDGTGQVGTYFYTAPEIEQGWPKIDEKVNWSYFFFSQYVLCLFSSSFAVKLSILFRDRTLPSLSHLIFQADMYSLGIVFFELWHPFGTAMERHIILSDLKQKGELPPSWVAQFPEQASLLQRLMSPIPSDRPSAADLLKHAFPPRMESELLDSE